MTLRVLAEAAFPLRSICDSMLGVIPACTASCLPLRPRSESGSRHRDRASELSPAEPFDRPAV